MLEFDLKDLNNPHQKFGIKVKIPSKIWKERCNKTNKLWRESLKSRIFDIKNCYDTQECEECKRISIQHLGSIIEFLNSK